MLSALLRRLTNPDASPLAAEDARIAVAALLVAAARADDRYEAAERDLIERVLMGRYGLPAPGAAALLADGEAAERAAIDIFRFTALIKQHVPLEERTAVIESLWRVMLADGVRSDDENHLMRRITDLLGVDPRDGVLARQRVQAGR